MLCSGSGFAFPVSPLREGEQTAGNRALGGDPCTRSTDPREHPHAQRLGGLEIADSASRSQVLCGRQKDEEGK